MWAAAAVTPERLVEDQASAAESREGRIIAGARGMAPEVELRLLAPYVSILLSEQERALLFR